MSEPRYFACLADAYSRVTDSVDPIVISCDNSSARLSAWQALASDAERVAWLVANPIIPSLTFAVSDRVVERVIAHYASHDAYLDRYFMVHGGLAADSGSPVLFNLTPEVAGRFNTASVEAPTTSHLLALTDPEDIADLVAEAGSQFDSLHLIPFPPRMAPFFGAFNTPTLSHFLVATAMECVEQRDKLPPDQQDAFAEAVGPLLKELWYRNSITVVTFAAKALSLQAFLPVDNQLILGRYNRFRNTYVSDLADIANLTPAQANVHMMRSHSVLAAAITTATGNMSELAISNASTNALLLEGGLSSSKSSSRSSWKNLSPEIKSMILVASTPKPTTAVPTPEVPTAPTVFAKQLLDSNRDSAFNLLVNTLHHKAGRNMYINYGLAYHIQTCSFYIHNSDTKLAPDSAFYMATATEAQTEAVTGDDFQIKIQSNTATSDFVERALKRPITVATSPAETVETHRNISALDDPFWSPESSLALGSKEAVRVLGRSITTMKSCQAKDPQFLTLLEAAWDKLRNQYFKLCLDWRLGQPVPVFDISTFSHRVSALQPITDIYVPLIVQKALLPPKAPPLANKKRDKNPTGEPAGKPGGAKKQKGTATTPPDAIPNPYFTAADKAHFALPDGKSYGMVYYKNIETVPQLDDKGLCANFHVRGACTNAQCRRAASHVKLSPAKKEELYNWATLAKEAAQP